MILSIYVVFHSKTLRFIKAQEASALLSSSEINTPLLQTPSVGPILF